ncbi:MAG: 7-carboxy-7-deazaguanine synthase QueE [Bacteroidales bacterium]|nr:7-carboxy-7-deazaguanine synthase QueE [Bacteroidales bacterium]
MKHYPITEHFFSLQGEGANVGKPAYFLRLSGCNVRCDFCDSKNSWDDANAQNKSSKEIADLVKKSGAKNVVVTGGEPLLHNLDELCQVLRAHVPNVCLWLETSGTAKFSGDFDWVCLSPKKHKLPLSENYAKTNELKVIVENSDDFEFAEQQAQQVNPDCELFLQGKWSNMGIARNTRTTGIINYILKNPKWRLSVQVHKFLRIL